MKWVQNYSLDKKFHLRYRNYYKYSNFLHKKKKKKNYKYSNKYMRRDPIMSVGDFYCYYNLLVIPCICMDILKKYTLRCMV